MVKFLIVFSLVLTGCAGTSAPVASSVHYCESGWGLVNEDYSIRKAKAYVVCTKQVKSANVYRKGSTETQWLTRAN